MKPKCNMCGRERTIYDDDYKTFAMLSGSSDPGWLSNPEEEICGACLVSLYNRANGIKP